MSLTRLPYGPLVYLLNKLPYFEKYRLKLVSKNFKKTLDFTLTLTDYREIVDILQLEHHADETYRGSANYAWYISQKDTYANLIKKVGWKVLEYDVLSQTLMKGFEDNSPESRSDFALENAIESPAIICMVKDMRNNFVKTRLRKFNDLYGTNLSEDDCGASFKDIPILFVVENDDKEFYLEFTLNDTECYNPHDFKMCYRWNFDKTDMEWVGLGVGWEKTPVRDILKSYWDADKKCYLKRQYFGNRDCGASHLFELIVYATHDTYHTT